MSMEQLGVLAGIAIAVYVLVWCGWQLALWAVRNSLIDCRKITRS